MTRHSIRSPALKKPCPRAFTSWKNPFYNNGNESGTGRRDQQDEKIKCFYSVYVSGTQPLRQDKLNDNNQCLNTRANRDSQRSHLSSFTMKLKDKFHSPKIIKRTPSKKGKPADLTVKTEEKPVNKTLSRLEEQEKEVVNALRYFKTIVDKMAVDKMVLVMLPGSASKVLEAILPLVQVDTHSQQSTAISSCYSRVYQSLANLIRWSDQVMLEGVNSEDKEVVTTVREVIKAVLDGVKVRIDHMSSNKTGPTGRDQSRRESRTPILRLETMAMGAFWKKNSGKKKKQKKKQKQKKQQQKKKQQQQQKKKKKKQQQHLVELTDEILKLLMELVFRLVCKGELSLAHMLRKNILEKVDNKRMQSHCNSAMRPLAARGVAARPGTLHDFHSHEIAEQLTLLNAELFYKIEIPEVLLWAKEQNEEKSPNLTQFTEHFNNMSYWVRSIIMLQEKAQDRERLLLKFIKIMKHLRKLNNFNSYLAILSALDSAPIRRLEWQKQTSEGLAEYCTLMDSSSSFRAYRTAHSEVEPPCIPYLGLILQDLTFVHLGNPDHIDGKVNFSKRWQQFNILDSMRRFQQAHYEIRRNDDIISFFNDFSDHLPEEALWELSLKIKPRNITRRKTER
ncbi:rap guanine nucleotide exchange factor 1-like [Pseudophryne corroboree]|uniref:rap guanine nucleotide exchange factor 1-like n=1 Tax=Pseudophryne corroboree TaxID=495146 RepID=UPI003081B21B